MAKYSKTGLILVIGMVVCVLLALAVVPGGFGGRDKSKDLEDENTPGLNTVLKEGTPILIYDKRPETLALLKAFDEDAVAAVEIMPREGDVVITSKDAEIISVYKALKNVVVVEEMAKGDKSSDTAEETADREEMAEFRSLTFKFADGNSCIFEFGGEKILVMDGRDYLITNTAGLWETLKELM